MSKVLVNESSLTGIANAIRGKNGSTTTYKPSEMAAAITAISGGGGPDIPDSAFVISGDCSYLNYYGNWDWFFNNYGDRITTKNLTSGTFMFNQSQIEEINFDINFSSYNSCPISFIYNGCTKLIKIKKMNNLRVSSMDALFKDCEKLRNIPDDFADTWDWSYLEGQTSEYTGSQNTIFQGCYSLRSIPMNIIKSGNPKMNYYYSYFNNGFYKCYSLDELTNLPILYTKATWTSNAFISTFNYCGRLKNITFAKQEDGTPYTVSWKSQTINLDTYVGYINYKTYILNYNSGITADKEVTDATTYAALKNDADWFTTNVAYSRYNHDSAVATINSLPDTSAYLATAGGTNTIKFKASAGSATDGGAINTLTEEEIAVATAKGWTVTLV